MRVLISSWPAYGHLLPMIPLARAVVRAGHELLVSSGPDITPLIEQRGFAAQPAGWTLAESYASAGAAMAEQGGPSGPFSEMTPADEMAMAARFLFGAGAVQRATDLLPVLAEWRPDLVVHENIEFGAPTAAEMLGIRHVTHSYGPIVPGSAEFATALSARLIEGGLPDPMASILAAPYLDICPQTLQPAGIAPWTVRVPLRPEAGEVLTGDELPPEFADLPHPATVYLTLGTITNQQPEVFRAVLAGCARHPVNVVATTGPGVDPADLGPLPQHVLVRPYIAQAAVLPHCAAVISHAGAGTMLGALCFGLPQLCLPQGTDQPHNSAALAATGAGVVLTKDRISSDAVADALGAVLGQASYRSAAEALRDEIAAMPSAAEVVAELL